MELKWAPKKGLKAKHSSGTSHRSISIFLEMPNLN